MVSCCYCGYSKTKGRVETFHMFPKNPLQLPKWINFMHTLMPGWQPSKNSTLCSKHFTPDCFDKSGKITRLKSMAIPTIKLENSLRVLSKQYEIEPQKVVQVLSEIPFIEMKSQEVSTINMKDNTEQPSTSEQTPEESTCTEISPALREEKLISTSLQVKETNEWTYNAAPDDTPRKSHLKKKIAEMTAREKLYMRQIRKLQKVTHQHKHRIKNLSSIIAQLKNNGMISHNTKEILQNCFGSNSNLFLKLIKRASYKKKSKTKYDEDIRKFAITLHYFSPRAYKYVRNIFNDALPHYKTLSKWYKTVNGEPGFTSESFEILKKKNENIEKNICCSLVFDEMSLRQHVEWVNDKVYGLVTIGNNVCDENIGYAKQVLVFMLVAINEAWKLPLGYFFIESLNSDKKADLVNHCLRLLADCKITVTNITFDCCPTNLTMAKVLGCKFEFEKQLNKSAKNPVLVLQTKIRYEIPVFVFPDPSHIMKLIRNILADIGILYDENHEEINFNYLKKLNELQENERLHLCNKINKRHIEFFKQKMKVKLATQLLSKSVAEALTFCSENLKLDEFKNCGPTVKFILMMNDAFDILNSRKISDFGFKQALCKKNIEKVEQFYENLFSYVTKLKKRDGTLVLNSNRKTGFLCLLISMQSLISMYKICIDKYNLSFIPVYKMSQDHLELFFGSIRSCGGYNNNPTCRQFISAYKKILIHAEIREHGVGNCIPLENINILRCSSDVSKKIVQIITTQILTTGTF